MKTGDPTVINIRAGFPVNGEGHQFAMNVNFATSQPTDDYDERMLLFAKAFRALADEIENQHAPEWGPDSPGYDEMGQ